MAIKSNTSQVSYPFIVALFLFILHDVPLIGYYTPSIAYAIIVVILGLTTYKLVGKDFFQYLTISLVICIPTHIRDLNISSSYIICLYGILQNIISLTIGIYIIKHNDYYLAKRTLILCLLVYTATAITTYFGNLAMPQASRMLATASDVQESLVMDAISRLNIGGFSFIYSLVLAIPLLIGMIKLKRTKLPLVLITLSFLMAIYISEYTTALILAAFSVPLLFSKRSLDIKTSKVYFIIYGGCVLFVLTIMPLVVGALEDVIDSDIISVRLADLSDFLDSPSDISADQSDLSSRYDLYRKSLESFFRSPLWGSLSFKQTGGHSLLFDSLGLLGIIGGLLFYYVWKKLYVHILKPYRDKPFFGYFLFSYVCALIMTIINPGLMVGHFSFIMPAAIVCFDNEYYS